MLSFREKPDWSTPGLSGRMKDGVYEGHLYTALPLRFKTAIKNAGLAALALTLVLIWFSSVEDAGKDAFAGFIAIFLFFTYPIFVCFDPGERIRITKEHLFVGAKRYDLKSCGRFWTWKSKYNRTDEVIHFDYGNKKKTIRVRNSIEHSGGIRDALNYAVDAVRSYAPQHAAPSMKTRLEVRSAHF